MLDICLKENKDQALKIDNVYKMSEIFNRREEKQIKTLLELNREVNKP